MQQRPILDKNLDSKIFRNYYFLKEELVEFCRDNGLPTTGSKLELTERITYFLETGETLIASIAKRQKVSIENISEDTEIETNFICSEKHRTFFREHIGKSFSFNVTFQKWLKSNTGKTYREAIEAYKSILEHKKNNKTSIDKQFEYNTYIRDFFADNSKKSLEEAIKCWKYKKQLQGHNRYEKSDLVALN